MGRFLCACLLVVSLLGSLVFIGITEPVGSHPIRRAGALLRADVVVEAKGTIHADGPIDVQDYGAAGDGVTDDTAAVQAALGAAIAAGGSTVFFPPGTYRCQIKLDTVSAHNNAPYACLRGSGTNATRLMAIDAGSPVISMTGTAAWGWTWAIRDLSFVGNDGAGNDRVGNGVEVNASGVLGCYFENVAFWQCDYGFHNKGALWYTFDHCTFSGNNFGVCIEAIPTMHGGCGFFQNCNWNANYTAAFALLEAASGYNVEQVHIVGGVNEGNPGFAFFSKGGSDWAHPLIIDNVYMEVNGTAASVTIAGESYEPTDIYLEDTARVIIQNMTLVGVEVVSETFVTANNCSWYSGFDIDITPDANNEVIFNDLELHGPGVFPHFVNSGMGPAARQTHLGNGIAWERTNLLSNGLCAVAFTPHDANGFSYSFVNTSTPLGFGLCAKLNLKPNADAWNDGIQLWRSNVRIKKNKWYVWSLDLKAEGEDGYVSFLGTGGEQLIWARDLPIHTDRWIRYIGWKRAVYDGDVYIWSFFNQTASDPDVLVCDAQLVEFDSLEEADQYILSRRVAPDDSIPRPFIDNIGLTTHYIVTPSMDNGTHFTNAGASDIVMIQLPPATAGQRYTFTRTASHDFRVDPYANECFRGQRPGKYLGTLTKP